MFESSEIPEALRPFVRAVEGRPDYIKRVARICSDMSSKVDAQELNTFAIKVRNLAPNDQIVLKFTGNIINKALPGWHFGCLDDVPRNLAYQKALNALIGPETIVLDIGAGCGVLSLFAAAAGAKHVYAVEIEPLAAEIAQEIVTKNGFQDQITIINKDILDVKLENEIPEKCNLVVQDIIWPSPFSKDIHKFLIYAQENLLTDNAIYCPQSIKLKGVLTDADSHIGWPDYSDYFGFDLSPMNMLRFRSPGFNRPHHSSPTVSEVFTIADYNLQKLEDLEDQSWKLDIPITNEGQIHYLLSWLSLEFPDGTNLENGPEAKSVRSLTVNRFYDPKLVKADQTVQLQFHLKDGIVESEI